MADGKDNVTRVFIAFEEDPSAMSKLLNGNETEVIRGILKDESLSEEELRDVTGKVNENNVVKLYMGANGQIDAAQLLGMTGGFTTAERGKKTDAIGALLDGKLDIKDILALMTLMNGGNNTSAQQSSGTGGLLSTLLGGQQQVQQQPQTVNPLGALFGLSQPQQQATQQNNNSQLNALLQTLAAQQQQQQAQQQVQQQQQSQTMNDLLSTLLSQAQQQQQVQQPQQTQQSQGGLLSQLLNQSGQQTSQQQTASSQTQTSATLNAPLFTEAPSTNTNSNTNTNNAAVNQLLGSSTTNSDGTVNVNSMFDLINILMGAK